MLRTVRRMVLGLLAASLALPWAVAEEKNKDKDKQPLLDTAAFIKKASAIDQDEIAVGRLAAERSARPDVKAYGMMLVRNHSKNYKEIEQLAAKNNWIIAGTPDEHGMHLVQKLSRLQGAEFDKEFLSHMVKGHKEAIQQFEAQAKNANNPIVKSYAEMSLPVLREHLKAAEKLQGETKEEKK